MLDLKQRAVKHSNELGNRAIRMAQRLKAWRIRMGMNSLRLAWLCSLLGGGACNRTEAVNRIEAFDAGPVFASETPLFAHEFTLKNTASHPLKILDESHSCSCTTVRVAPKLIPPGESGKVRMEVRLGNAYELHSLVCDVKTDHREVPDRRFVLNLTTYPRSRVVPSDINFGNVAAKEPHGGEQLEVSNKEVDSPQVKQAWLEVFTRANSKAASPVLNKSLVPPELLVSLNPNAIVEALPDGMLRHRYPLTVALKSLKLPEQSYRRAVVFKMDDDTSTSMIIDWRIAGTLTCTPSVLSFGMFGPNQNATKTLNVTIFSKNTKPFKIINVDTGSPSLTIPGEGFPTQSTRSHLLPFTFTTPRSDVRALSGVVVIKTDDPQSTELRVPWSVYIRPSETVVRRPND